MDRLRETLRFDDVDALLVQMAQDVEQTRDVLGAPSLPEEQGGQRQVD